MQHDVVEVGDVEALEDLGEQLSGDAPAGARFGRPNGTDERGLFGQAVDERLEAPGADRLRAEDAGAEVELVVAGEVSLDVLEVVQRQDGEAGEFPGVPSP